MTARPPALVQGQRFRGLLVHGLLGSGGMGAAYLASHSVLKTPLVVKTFVPTQRDLFREAHLAARVESPHVVDVLDAGHEEGIPFVVQRYVDGLDLHELLSRLREQGRALPTAAVTRMVVDAARGLHAIHQAGVLHRDVKPANLFLGGAGRTLVGDFGIAVDPAEAGARVDGFAGTPWFTAPEIWRDEAADARADVYSLGAATHLLATGEPPFTGVLPALAHAHVHEDYVPPEARAPDAAYLFAATRQMLAKGRGERPKSAEAVAELLEPIARELEPLTLSSPTEASVGGLRIELALGDLSREQADVIVNAANWKLHMEVGVARALREAGGEALQQEALAQGPAGMGDIVWTTAGALEAEHVAHAVSALAGAVCLARCTMRVLLGAARRGARTVAFPALGTGVGEVPHAQAAKLMLQAMRTVAAIGRGSVERVRVVLHDDDALAAWKRALPVV